MTIVTFGGAWPYAILVAALLLFVARWWIGRNIRRIPVTPIPTGDARFDVAREVVADLRGERFEGIVARFDEKLSSKLSVAELRRAWDRVVARYGEVREVREVKGSRIGALDVVDVIVTHEEPGEHAVRVVFDVAGRISGLWFKPVVVDARRPPPPAGLREETVTVGTAPWALPGTLTLPPGGGPFPAVVLVDGSGPPDRDATLGDWKPFRDLAWALAGRGVAVLRYDKRTAVHAEAMHAKKADLTLDDETIDDALAAATLLRARADVGHVFVVGHSLGGTLAPRIAARDQAIAGIVVLGAATPPASRVHALGHLFIDEEAGMLDARVADEIAAFVTNAS